MTGAGGGAPLHARISDTIAEAIAGGQYPPASLLPGEMELCARFKASRTTIRTALETLRHRGLISRRAGIGTKVEAPAGAVATSGATHWTGALATIGAGLAFDLVEAHRMTAAAAAARFLGCAEGDRLQVLRGLVGPAAGPPVSLVTHHIPEVETGLALRLSAGPGTVAARVERETGRTIAAVRRTVEAVALGAREAGLLRAGPGEPALSVWHWFTGQDGALVLASHDLVPQSRGTLEDTRKM